MTSAALAATSVLVTRPREHATALCAMIEQHGGVAISWPTVTIEPRAPGQDALKDLEQADPKDIAIFVSRNAVRHGADLLRQSPALRIAAVGRATMTELQDSGFDVDILPTDPDSEGLLAHDALQDVDGRRVFIVRGVGGRGLLGRELAARGARVIFVEVYERLCPSPAAEELEGVVSRWTAGDCRLFTATSVEILDNLATMLGPQHAELFRASALVAVSNRVVKRAGEIGHRGAQLLATGPDDQSLLDVMIAWNRTAPKDAPEGP